jgi:steroid 5-alpha reductase family enzyme
VIGAPFDVGSWLAALPFLVVAATFTWLLSIPLRNVSIAGSTWSLMIFAAGVIYALGADPRAPRLSLVLWMLALWAFRLAFHVTARGARQGEDHRYQAIRARHEPGFQWKSLYLVFWPRALLAWVISLPILGAFATIRPLGVLDWAGVLLWIIGFVTEAIADRQLARFRKSPANLGAVLDRGLWRYTRHPNYFGELCVWSGFWLVALSAGAGWAAVSPLLLFALLRLSETARLERDTGNRRPGYADYVLKTHAFFPGPPRK